MLRPHAKQAATAQAGGLHKADRGLKMIQDILGKRRRPRARRDGGWGWGQGGGGEGRPPRPRVGCGVWGVRWRRRSGQRGSVPSAARPSTPGRPGTHPEPLLQTPEDEGKQRRRQRLTRAAERITYP